MTSLHRELSRIWSAVTGDGKIVGPAFKGEVYGRPTTRWIEATELTPGQFMMELIEANSEGLNRINYMNYGSKIGVIPAHEVKPFIDSSALDWTTTCTFKPA